MNSNFKFGTVGYIPPPTVGFPMAFLRNLKNFPSKHPLYLFSDHDWSDEWPEIIRLAASPEIAKVSTNRMSCNNLIFFMAARIASMRGLTHLMLIEPDCRVNVAAYDDIIWREFVSKNAYALAGGSIVVFNPCSYNRKAAERYERFVADSRQGRLVPMSVAGNVQLAERNDSCVFPNGAFAVYSVDYLKKIYPEICDQSSNMIRLAQTAKTWDHAISMKLWEEFKEGVYDRVVPINSIYSGYGNIMSSEEERKQWLIDGKIVGVHQIKSDWAGPEPTKTKIELTGKNPEGFAPKVEILIVSYIGDLEFCKYNLKSIQKFATGFAGVTVVVPASDKRYFSRMCEKYGAKLKTRDVVEGKGFLTHEIAKCEADLYCPEADFILHSDSDCIFQEPVKPLDYFEGGKPILLCRPYRHVKIIEPGHEVWKAIAERNTGLAITHDFMVRQNIIHAAKIYQPFREHVTRTHKQPFRDYVLAQDSEFPHGFTEFPSIGAFANEFFYDSYKIIDFGDQPEPHNKVLQGWTKEGVNHVIKYKDGIQSNHVDRCKALGIE